MKIGLKLWSTNKNYINPAIEAYKNDFYDYIELFYVPGSLDSLSLWKNIEIPFIIHAPHTTAGLNPASLSQFDSNLKLAKESFQFAEALKADFVIFHPGMAGVPQETVRQIRSFGDTSKMLIENKPYHSIAEPNLLCRGSTPEEFKYILAETNASFCLDMGHAICAANSLGRDKLEFIDEFISLGPKMFHLSDNDLNSPIDAHFNFGQGNYPLKLLFNKIPSDSMLSIETNKAYPDSLRDFEADVLYLRQLGEKIQ